ncbi:protease inhibitor I42 family protein [Candidatus Bipolaricaulota bacterium]
MRTYKVLAVIAGLLALATMLSGCWLLPVTIDETADGTVQSIEIGDEILIQLSGDASTGFQWIRAEPESLDGTPLEVVSEGDYEPDDPGVCGGSGVFSFRYHAVASGTIALSFAHRRPWEDETAGSFSIIIWVR